jgi:NADPH2:quinone reductase
MNDDSRERPSPGRSDTMRAVQCLEFGEPARLNAATLPRPDLLPGTARVRVEYCGIGLPDALIVGGKYQVKPRLPFIPGSEIAGVVVETLAGVDHPRVGARVAGLNYEFTGGLAEEIVSPIDAMTVIPPGVPTRSAAGMLVNYGTAYHGLVQRGALRPGESVLVLGAAGGVGLACIEVANAHGAIVIAACGSAAKLTTAERHGAAQAFDYSRGPLKPEVMALTGGRGVDVVVDPVGGAYTEEAMRCLKPGGRLLVVGFASGEIARIATNLALLKNCSIVGVSLGAQVRHDPSGWRANVGALFGLYEQGLLSPELVEVDGLRDYAEGFAAVARRARVGKIVMRICGGNLE